MATALFGIILKIRGNASCVSGLSACLMILFLLAGSGQNLQGQILRDLQDELESSQVIEEENPFKLTGQIVGPTGPVENVTVNLEVRDVRERRPFLFLNVQTDPQGYFEFDLSNVSAYEIAMEVYTVSYRHTMSRWFERVPKNELPMNAIINVQPGVVIQGIVVDEEDNPIEGALLSGAELINEETDEDGKFEVFGLMPNGHNVKVDKLGYTRLTEYFSNAGEPGLIPDIKLVMVSSSRFAGTVVNWKGEPVSNARVVFQMPRRFQEERTDRDGKFEFVGIPTDLDNAVLEVIPFEDPPKNVALSRDDIESEEVEVRLPPAAGIFGVIDLPSGFPASSTTVRVESVEDDENEPLYWQTSADTRGQFHLNTLVPGKSYRLNFDPSLVKRDYAIADITILDLTSGIEAQDPTGSLELDGFVEFWPDGHSSSFKVMRNSGYELGMVRTDTGDGGFSGEITYTGQWDENQKVFRGDMRVESIGMDGQFFLKPRNANREGMIGDWVLTENYDVPVLCFEAETVEISLPRIPGDKFVRTKFEEGFNIEGRVQFDDPDCIGGVVVLMSNEMESEVFMTAEIDFDGYFEFSCLPPGISWVTVYDKCDNESDTQVIHDGMDTVVLRSGEEQEVPAIEFSFDVAP